MTLRDLKFEFRLTADGDGWGNAMHWWFVIADEIHFEREALSVPDDWHFRASPLGSSNEDDDYAVTAVREADDGTLMAFGALMHRYARLLKHLGKSY